MNQFDDHFAAACLTQIWAYRNQDKVNINLLDQNFKVQMIGIGLVPLTVRVEFIDVLDPGDTDPVILVVLTTGVEYRINPKTRTIIEGVSP